MSDFARDHCDLAARFATAPDQDAVFATFSDELDRLGFAKFIYAQMHIDARGQRSAYANRSTTDPDMRAAYARERIFEADPLIEHVISSPRDKLWSSLFDTTALAQMPARFRRMSEVAHGFGLTGGASLRLGARAAGAGQLMTGVSVMAAPGTSTAAHDRHFTEVRPQLMQVIDHFSAAVDTQTVANRHYQLTPREIEVLQFSADGFQVQQIADHTGLADRTVAHHLASARRKLNARSTAHAIAIAFRAAIL